MRWLNWTIQGFQEPYYPAIPQPEEAPSDPMAPCGASVSSHSQRHLCNGARSHVWHVQCRCFRPVGIHVWFNSLQTTLQAPESQVKGQHTGAMIQGGVDTSPEQSSLTVNEQKDIPGMDRAGDRRWWQDEAAKPPCSQPEHGVLPPNK